MKIKKFHELSIQSDMTDFFIENLRSKILEDKVDKSFVEDIIKKTQKDLKLNFTILATYGAGITAIYPIIFDLVNNSKLNIDMSPEKIVLLIITALTIVYLEEGKLDIKKAEGVKRDSKTMLEELKLNGIGNNIVKKVIKCFKSVQNIFNLIGKHSGKIAEYIYDMFSYTALLIPFLNAVAAVVGKYDLNIDTLPGNFIGIGVGIGSIVAKNGISYIIDKMKGKTKINKEKALKDVGDEKHPKNVELIKEKI